MDNRTLGVSHEPNLSDFMTLIKRDISLSINCIQIGKIESYNVVTNTASVKISFKRKLATGEIVDYPILQDCPVVILNGGGSSLTFPIAKGDQCLILFNDRNIDNWYLDGSIKEPRDNRLHSFADGMVLVGVSDSAHAIIGPTQSACLNGGPNKVSIKNDTTDLKTLILALIDAILAMTQTVAGGGGGTTVSPPVNAATFATLKTQFETLLDEGIL
jgi:hypothetical protein